MPFGEQFTALPIPFLPAGAGGAAIRIACRMGKGKKQLATCFLRGATDWSLSVRLCGWHSAPPGSVLTFHIHVSMCSSRVRAFLRSMHLKHFVPRKASSRDFSS